MSTWFFEKMEDYYQMGYRVEEKLFEEQSPFQKVTVYQTTHHGKMLCNDDLIMITEADEFIYHDMIAHVPLFVHPNPKKVLVIGGGDGGTAREVLRHEGIEKCVMVEIDEAVVRACKKFIPQTSAVFDHPKLELRIEDGVEYVAGTTERFDIILIDSTDPIGPAQPLFGSAFYKDLYRILTEEGIVVSQGESPFYLNHLQKHLAEIVSDIFPITRFYNFHNFSYPGGLWSFSFASKKWHPLFDIQEDRLQSSPLSFEYYNKEIHKAAFALPTYQRKALSGLLKDGGRTK
jgi:spermidine synthase